MSRDKIKIPAIDMALFDIDEILTKYNLAGIVVLQHPGAIRVLSKLDPTFSCVKMHSNGRMSFKADLQDDFGGNKVALEQRVKDSAEMLNSIIVAGSQLILPIGELHRNVTKILTEANDCVIKEMPPKQP